MCSVVDLFFVHSKQSHVARGVENLPDMAPSEATPRTRLHMRLLGVAFPITSYMLQISQGIALYPLKRPLSHSFRVPHKKGRQKEFDDFLSFLVAFRSLFLTLLSLFSSFFARLLLQHTVGHLGGIASQCRYYTNKMGCCIKTVTIEWVTKLAPAVKLTWEFAKGGAKRIVRFWGGGGKRTIKHPVQNQFWRPQKVGFVWSVPVSSKENDIARTKGGGNRIISGGVQNRFWGGDLWYVYPSPEFSPPPLLFSG